ncbi:MAG: hypothetical protein QM757_01425 [Paludibaculum sp.]
MRTASILLAAILVVLCQVALVAQPSSLPMPTFLGTVKGSDGKILSIESDDGNTMQFTCTRKTEFFDGKKRIKATDLQPGEYVSVEAKLMPDRSMDAVVVHREKRPDA